MPEFNRNFAQGKMNKDLDERIVPAGQYREALNVEVSTSEGSDVGALQTLWGNTEVTPNVVPSGSYCVGSIVNNEENCIYWLVAGADQTVPSQTVLPTVLGNGSTISKDYILKYHIDTGTTTYVFVDIYKVQTTIQNVNAPDDIITVNSTEGLRPGMVAKTPNGDVVIKHLGLPAQTNDQVFLEEGFDSSLLSSGDVLEFRAKRVLNFTKHQDITGVNIVDDFIMFTDDLSEPKLVSIKRSIMGTGGVANGLFSIGEGQDAITHTRLISKRRDGLFVDEGFEIVNNPNFVDEYPEFSELENNTTIKKNPLTPPTLNMSPTTLDRVNGSVVGQTTYGAFVGGTPPATAATGTQVQLTFDQAMAFQPGDFVVLTNDLTQNPTSFTDFDVRLQVLPPNGGALEYPIGTITFNFTITSIDPEISTDQVFFAMLQQTDPLFEFKFPRFGYRYKYVDGQYSAFSPFSEVAFIPGPFSMDPLEGYNLGMANRLRTLQVQNYAPHPNNRPKDIVEIDILYKEDKSPTIYTVKTIRRQDGFNSELWPEDSGGISDYIDINTLSLRGSINITSELIHAILPENQLLRPWDNVPRLAKAQEVSANRLIYGNYLHNYDLLDTDNQLITPAAYLTTSSFNYTDLGVTVEQPLTSVKTMRTYQLGVVYRDDMGRETPVLADKEKGSVYTGKEICDQQTKLITKIRNNAPAWASSFKFFIKETSDEYYNLALDRWYGAEDGNVWLSFQSSDRNKVDIETFLELKKGHDRQTPVTEPARYKILAIENEAPQYIKLNRRSQGLVTNSAVGTTQDAQIGDANQGFPTVDNNFITIRSAAFEEAFGGDAGSQTVPDVFTKASECSLKIRRLTGDRSEWYKIVRIELGSYFGGGSDDGYRIQVSTAFGPDISFCGTSFANRATALQIEITHDEYVDKPEFDGKFFVKVFRDRVLEENVIILDDDDLVVVNSYPIGYLHTYKQATGGTGIVANTKNDAKGIALNVLDRYFEGLAGNGEPHSASGGPGSATCHPHPLGYSNDNGNPYRWGDNSAAGSLPHPYLTVDTWATHPDPSEENGPTAADDAFNDADGVSESADAGGLFGGFANVFDFIGDFFANTLPGLVLGDNGHRGIGKHAWGSVFWTDLTTKIDGGGQVTTNNPYVFIDDAWAISWFYSDEMIVNEYTGNNTLGGTDGDQEEESFRASLQMHSAPWVGDYGKGPNDENFGGTFDYSFRGIQYSLSYVDLLVAPWEGRNTPSRNGNGTNWRRIDKGTNYFANGNSTTSANWTINAPTHPGDPYQDLDPDQTEDTQDFGGGWNVSGVDAPFWAQNGSAGIRGNSIDLSVVGGMCSGSEYGFGPDIANGQENGDSTDAMRFLGHGAGLPQSTAAVQFFRQILEPGVRWRFRGDPDNTVYTTQDSYEHYGIVNYQRSDSSAVATSKGDYYNYSNKRNKFTIRTDVAFGSGPSGWIPTANMAHDGSESISIEILGPYQSEDSGPPSDDPAVFETHPKEDIGLDIYYEISRAYPVRLSKEDDETLSFLNSAIEGHLDAAGLFTAFTGIFIYDYEHNTDMTGAQMVRVQLRDGNLNPIDITAQGVNIVSGDVLRVRDSWGGTVDVVVGAAPNIGDSFISIDSNIHNKRIELPWHNCYVFGNGVESDRIRDDFNQPTIQNGVKASTTIAEQYKEERRKEGLIFSGIYNSRSGVNRLNQFIQAEPITKDLNPDNGSIQKLFTRDTDIVTFCEDKVLRILSQKDALFNADGNSNVTATSKVLGSAIPFAGDYGISQNPESFAADRYRCYFADTQRGAVLRLSKDGITNISDYGMKDWFTDKFYSLDRPRIVGGFDSRKENYNITITNRTGSVTVVPNQNVNFGEMVFTGISAGMYEHGLGHVSPIFFNGHDNGGPAFNHGDPHAQGEGGGGQNYIFTDSTDDLLNTLFDSFGADISGVGSPHPLTDLGFPGWNSDGVWTDPNTGVIYNNDGTWSNPNNNVSGVWASNFGPTTFDTPGGGFEGDTGSPGSFNSSGTSSSFGSNGNPTGGAGTIPAPASFTGWQGSYPGFWTDPDTGIMYVEDGTTWTYCCPQPGPCVYFGQQGTWAEPWGPNNEWVDMFCGPSANSGMLFTYGGGGSASAAQWFGAGGPNQTGSASTSSSTGAGAAVSTGTPTDIFGTGSAAVSSGVDGGVTVSPFVSTGTADSHGIGPTGGYNLAGLGTSFFADSHSETGYVNSFGQSVSPIGINNTVNTYGNTIHGYPIWLWPVSTEIDDIYNWHTPVSLSFNEPTNGWVCFNSFHHEDSVTVNNHYYTFVGGSMWQHHINTRRNNFYNFDNNSYVDVVFNDAHSSVKGFQTIKYEGSQSRINKFSTVVKNGIEYTDKEYYNLNEKTGWYVQQAETDLQTGKVPEFINKEGKWFNIIKGDCTNLQNLDESEFSVQGIGFADLQHSDPTSTGPTGDDAVVTDTGGDVIGHGDDQADLDRGDEVSINTINIVVQDSNQDVDATSWD